MKYYQHIAKRYAPYYALVAANSAAEAKSIYESAVNAPDGNSLREISEQEARAAYGEDGTAIGDLDKDFDNWVQNSPSILLLDRIYL